ncbi:MAG: hypothetical protein U0163_10660 [Gemmatimonadaceae bacterium]
MPRLRKLPRPERAAERAISNIETKVLAAEGRRSVNRKANIATTVAKRAVKRAAVASAVVATVTVMREVRRRRKLDA